MVSTFGLHAVHSCASLVPVCLANCRIVLKSEIASEMKRNVVLYCNSQYICSILKPVILFAPTSQWRTVYLSDIERTVLSELQCIILHMLRHNFFIYIGFMFKGRRHTKRFSNCFYSNCSVSLSLWMFFFPYFNACCPGSIPHVSEESSCKGNRGDNLPDTMPRSALTNRIKFLTNKMLNTSLLCLWYLKRKNI